jgi:hypothetical protein
MYAAPRNLCGKWSRQMSGKDQRSFERIPNTDLPIIFRSMLVDIGEHKNICAETVDVSTTGVGLTLSLSPEILEGQSHIILHSSDQRYKFRGQIVHVEKLSDGFYRLGIVLNY